MYPTTPVLFIKPNLVVGRDVDDDGDEWALPVGLGYDPVGEQPAGGLVLSNWRVPPENGSAVEMGCKASVPSKVHLAFILKV